MIGDAAVGKSSVLLKYTVFLEFCLFTHGILGQHIPRLIHEYYWSWFQNKGDNRRQQVCQTSNRYTKLFSDVNNIFSGIQQARRGSRPLLVLIIEVYSYTLISPSINSFFNRLTGHNSHVWSHGSKFLQKPRRLDQGNRNVGSFGFHSIKNNLLKKLRKWSSQTSDRQQIGPWVQETDRLWHSQLICQSTQHEVLRDFGQKWPKCRGDL